MLYSTKLADDGYLYGGVKWLLVIYEKKVYCEDYCPLSSENNDDEKILPC